MSGRVSACRTRPAGSSSRSCCPRVRVRPGDGQHRRVHGHVRRARHGLEHHGWVHRLRLARPRPRSSGSARTRSASCSRTSAFRRGYEPFLFVPVAGALTVVLALAIGWIALRTRAATFVIVTIAMMFMSSCSPRTWWGSPVVGAGLSFPVPPWTGALLRHAVLLRDAGDGDGRARHLVVDPALEVRSRPARHPRRRGQGARRRRPRARVQAHRVHHQRRSRGDDRRHLRLLRDLHLPAVRDRSAGRRSRWC